MLVAALFTRISMRPNSRVVVHQVFELIRASHVTGDRLDRRSYFSRDLIQRFLLTSGDDHCSAFAREDLGDRSSNAPARTRDDGNLVFKNHAESG